MTFVEFREKMQEHFQEMVKGQPVLYITDISRDLIWEKYITSFPEEIRQSNNCNACRQFLRPYANVVTINDDLTIDTLWNFEIADKDSEYEKTRQEMHNAVSQAEVISTFLFESKSVGLKNNKQRLEDGTVLTWNHFQLDIPAVFVHNSKQVSSASKIGLRNSTADSFSLGLAEITIEAVKTVIELIEQNSLYRGDQYKHALVEFLKLKKQYDKLPSLKKKKLFVWKISATLAGEIAKIRSTAIGTLLTDLSKNKELDHAVRSFEAIVAPVNYKRSTPIVTEAMKKAARARIKELGIQDSLQRRYATMDDITVTNTLFIDRPSKLEVDDVFNKLEVTTPDINPKNLSKIETIHIDKFIQNVLPNITSMEVAVENRHEPNFMALTAPLNPNSPSMFQWNNGIAWAYNNDVTDAIKEKVKAAGGSVDGAMRVSLSWHNCDDLDLHVIDPRGSHTYFGKPRPSQTAGFLDVDMNAVSCKSTSPVENVTWEKKEYILPGKYQISVENYSKRSNTNVGYSLQIEFDGQIYQFDRSQSPTQSHKDVYHMHYSKSKGLVMMTEGANSSVHSKVLFGIETNKFQKVNTMLLSPNCWGDNCIGNKHYFFIISKAAMTTPIRGFFNEYLRQELNAERKIFEALGSALKVEPSDYQLCGVGFSSTLRNSIICRVTGAFTRTLKIEF